MQNPMPSKKIGDVILDVKNISLSFGGVKALTDISFDVREHEIRSIIGPNGAGKSSMLNCINGVYHPQQGIITFRGKQFRDMNSREVAEMGVARTFQNLALFKGVVMDISDRVVVLDYGKKIGDGAPDEVRANPEVIKAYLGTSH